MGLLHYENILGGGFIGNFGIIGLNNKRIKEKRYLVKKTYGPTLSTISTFIGSYVPYSIDDPH
jgi:hypothetical protein